MFNVNVKDTRTKLIDVIALSSLVTYSIQHISANSYLFRVNNKNTKGRCEICQKLTMKTPERHH